MNIAKNNFVGQQVNKEGQYSTINVKPTPSINVGANGFTCRYGRQELTETSNTFVVFIQIFIIYNTWHQEENAVPIMWRIEQAS